MERYVAGRGAIGDYLLEIFKDYRKDHFAWSKVLWDMTAVAWVINARWLPSDLRGGPLQPADAPALPVRPSFSGAGSCNSLLQCGHYNNPISFVSFYFSINLDILPSYCISSL